MNLINSLRRYIETKHPDATVELAPPLRSDGIWSLDVDSSDKHFTVEWSASTGFGFSSASDDTFGEAADEILQSLDQAQRRIDQLLTGREKTAPSLPMLLSRLRERLGLTQQELASRLGVRQATVSGLERRQDIQVSTLQRVIEALGGELEIIGAFQDARYRIVIRSSGEQHSGEVTLCPEVRVRKSADHQASSELETAVLHEVQEGDDVRFSSLKRHNQLENSNRIARLIRARGSFFAECA